ncbi:MAG: tetratricopeptide repeat protein [Acidobacteriota bacterium]
MHSPKMLLLIVAALAVTSAAQRPAVIRSFTFNTEPAAIIWIDDVRYGKTGSDGKFTVKTVAPGGHTVRVRAEGFKDTFKAITAVQKGDVNIPLPRTDDPAELKYQEAERVASSDPDKAAESYREVIRLRPGYSRAYIGLARVLSESSDTDGALAAIRDLRKTSTRNAEASAVEGRIYKDLGDDGKAIAAFKRAIREGNGFQPEAYTGLGLLYQDRAQNLGAKGDTSVESAAYVQSAIYLATGLKQLSGAPDASVLYQLLGLVLERQKKYQQAIDLYHEYLRYFPDSSDAAAVQSFIVQLKKQMSEQ